MLTMYFRVAAPTPRPFTAPVEPDPCEPLIPAPDGDGELVSLGAAASYFGIPIRELRAAWIAAAVRRAGTDAVWAAQYGITVPEWKDARTVTPRGALPSEDCSRWHPFGAEVSRC